MLKEATDVGEITHQEQGEEVASARASSIMEDQGESHIDSGGREDATEWDTSEWDAAEEQEQGCQPYIDNYNQEMVISPPTVDQPTG